MKSQSNHIPARILDLSDGRSHFNYNIEEDGEFYNYDCLVLENPATNENIIAALIRQNYSINDEIAIIRQKTEKPTRYNEYFDFVESCKVIVNGQPAETIPETITAIQFITQLEFEQINEEAILAFISTMEEPHRTIARVSYLRANSFERHNPFIELIGFAFGKTETEIDKIFTDASNI